MSKVIIGTAGGKNIGFDVDLLLRTRLLLQADSGGGKSWVIRRLAEQLFGKVQTILIDPEGEFATLREKFDFVLVGKGGETPADPRSAGLVARRLLELRASAVCDLYELKYHSRHTWVRLFLEAMIEAPKELWRPVVVIVDEAHSFCPERGKGESEALGSMIDLATKGRKRGYCAVWATQSLGKLNKDGSGMLQNRLIGPTFEDLNRKRAAEILGIEPGAATRKFYEEIKLLEPGNFFALGRAISIDRVMVHIGPVVTTHPEMGSTKHSMPAPPAPEKIRALLPKLADLPKEAEEKAQSERELRTEIRGLKQKLAIAGRAEPTPAQLSAAPNPAELRKVIAVAVKPLQEFQRLTVGQVVRATKSLSSAKASLDIVFGTALESLQRIADAAEKTTDPTPAALPTAPPSHTHPRTVAVRPAPVVTLPARGGSSPADSNGRVTAKADRSILSVLATHGACSMEKVAVLAGYSVDGGGFRNALGRLRTNGFITPVKVEPIQITDAGRDALGAADPVPQGQALFDYWLNADALTQAGREILSVLAAVNPKALTKEEIAEATPSHYEPKGGGFNNQLGRLRTLGIVTGYAQIELCEELKTALEESAYV